jgi:hypothetical protein
VKYCEAMLEEAPESAAMHLLGRDKIAENFGERLGLRAGGSAGAGAGEGKGFEPQGEGGCSSGEERADMTGAAKLVLNILTRMVHLEKPVTLLGLADLWKGTGRKESFNLPAETAPKGWKKADCERLLVLMLLEGVLRQRFAYTAYAVNSYMEVGPKGQGILAGSESLLVARRWAQVGESKGKAAKAKKPAKRQRKAVEEETGDDEDADRPLGARNKCAAGAPCPFFTKPCGLVAREGGRERKLCVYVSEVRR